MERLKLYSVLAVLAVLSAACNQKGEDLTPDLNSVTLTAGISSDSQTRTVLGDDSGEQTEVYWSDDESDAFSVEIDGNIYTFQKAGETVNSTVADFVCASAPEIVPGEYLAKYPSEEISVYTTQEGTKASLNKYHYMEAPFTVTEGQTWKDLNLQFVTKVAIVKLTLSNEAFKGKSVTDVSLVSQGATIVSSITPFEGDAADGSIVVYFAIPSVYFDTKGVSIKASCEGKYYVSALEDNTLAAGKLYKVTKTMEEGVVDLSKAGTANCYIVSTSGTYKFKTVKGNSSEPVGSVSTAEVLWESFGTDVKPNVGDLISSVSYSDGYVSFCTNQTYKEGNALIAVKDNKGTDDTSDDVILWSWHIWITDQPEGQVYFNNAGTMMDRNLGATSATPKDIGAFGLLYQWGRKDPFLGTSSLTLNNETIALSTLTWPAFVISNTETGTIAYSVANPTTFIAYNKYGNDSDPTNNANNNDWFYSADSSTDNTRWSVNKTIYDPCPVGWRVPDGGETGIWTKAFDGEAQYSTPTSYMGINFSGKIGAVSTIWYPASGVLFHQNGSLRSASYLGYYWSVTPVNEYAYSLGFSGYQKDTDTSYDDYGRATALAVRCVQE